MIPLSSSISHSLKWSEARPNRRYEFKLGDDVVGTVDRPNFRSASFLANAQNGCWMFRRGGLLGAGAEILESASQQQIARFKAVWPGGGTLIFADGQTFHFECKGLLDPVWSVTTSRRQPVLHLHTRERTIELSAGVDVSDSRLFLLILFAGYLVLRAEEDAASAAMVA